MDQPRDPLAFPRFFNPAELGRSLQEVSTDLLRTDYKDIISRWLHSPNDVDLFIWMDVDRNVIKQQISFYGQVVEWNLIEGVKTGLIVEDGRPGMTDAEVVRFDAKAQKGPIRQAIDLLRHIAVLKEDERNLLIRNFENPNASTTMPPELFMERFGAILGARQGKPSKPKLSLWQRFKAWLLK